MPPGGPSPFNLFKHGVVTASKPGEWIDLGLIPEGQQYQIGLVEVTPIDAAAKFEMRPNDSTKSAGSIGETYVVGKAGARPGKTKKMDLYRRGRLFKTTALSTGVEHWWLRVVVKQTTEILYTVSYLELI